MPLSLFKRVFLTKTLYVMLFLDLIHADLLMKLDIVFLVTRLCNS